MLIVHSSTRLIITLEVLEHNHQAEPLGGLRERSVVREPLPRRPSFILQPAAVPLLLPGPSPFGAALA